MNKSQTQDLINQYGYDNLKLLEAVGGFYEVAKNAEGKRLTPLVGYAGKYPKNGQEFQYVGEVYVNFAKAEEHPHIMYNFAKKLWDKLKIHEPIVFIGPAMGGISVAQLLTLHASQDTKARYACAEKIVTVAKTATTEEQSSFSILRHSLYPGETVGIVEDVLNNFSTTDKLIRLVESYGAKVGIIVGLLNRSTKIDSVYMHRGQPIPVVSLIRKSFESYEQEDLYVIEDVAADNVVWKPKNDWDKLKKAAEKK